jgi:O-antigen ligase
LTYTPVVDRIAIPVALDPLALVLFCAAFVAVALLTARRPSYGLCALILTTPIAFAHDVAHTTVTLPKVVLLATLLGLSCRRGGIAALRRRPAALVLAVLGVYVAATILSAIHAAHRADVARETLKWIEYGAIFVTAYLCYRFDSDDVLPLRATALVAFVVAISALGQEFAGAPSGLYVGSAIVPRIAGLLEGPNQLAAYITIAFCVLAAWNVARPNRSVAVALGFLACADVLTFSRAGMLTLLVAVAIVALWSGRRAWTAWRPAILGAFAGIAGAIWWAIYAHTPGILRVSLASSAYAGGVGNRSELWGAAWRMFLAHPIFGVGAGNFELELPYYGVYGVRTHANSWYLQSLAEGGLVLFGATIALVVTSIRALLQRPVLARLREQSPWVAAALAASVALALHQIVDDFVFYPKVGGAWFVLLGIAAAALR